MKKRSETQTLRAGCSKVEPNIFVPPQIPFPGARDGQNLISWRWSLPLPTNPVWWGSMHAISSYRGNRPSHTQTHTPTHIQDRLQYTAPQLAHSVKINRQQQHNWKTLPATDLTKFSSWSPINNTSTFSLSLRFNGHFPGGPGLAVTRMYPFWILLELRVMEVVVTNWKYKTCKAPVKSSPPTNQHPVFLQAGSPSCHPTNTFCATKNDSALRWHSMPSQHFSQAEQATVLQTRTGGVSGAVPSAAV